MIPDTTRDGRPGRAPDGGDQSGRDLDPLLDALRASEAQRANLHRKDDALDTAPRSVKLDAAAQRPPTGQTGWGRQLSCVCDDSPARSRRSSQGTRREAQWLEPMWSARWDLVQ